MCPRLIRNRECGVSASRGTCFGEYYRHTAKRIALADDLREHLRSAAQQPDNAADAAAEVRMRAEVVRRAVMSLDARSRELVTLIHWDGFTIAEAARLLSMNESTARTRYGRALQRLQRGL